MYALDLPQTKISRHLNLIKMNGLLKDMVEELLTTELYRSDYKGLLKMKNCPNFACRKDKHTATD